MQTIITIPVDVPAPGDDAYETDVLGRRVLRHDWRPKPPKDGWSIFGLVRGAKKPEPITPERAAELVRSGEATIEDVAEMRRAIAAFRARVRMPASEYALYSRPAQEMDNRRKREAHVAICERMGLTPGDDVDPRVTPVLLTLEETADLLRVSTDTVRRQAGQSLPAPLRIGGRLLFRSEALLKMLEGRAA